MKSNTWIAILMVMAGGTSASEPVMAGDKALCQGKYPVLLMTETECRLFVQQVRSLQGQRHADARQGLELHHQALLRERAAACACVPPESRPPAVVAGDC